MGGTIKKAVEKNWAFWICLGVSIVLIVGGALTPPPFVIDSSIFIATGEMLAFASLWVLYRAVEKGVDAKITKGDMELKLENPDNNDNGRQHTDNEEHRHHHED